MVRHSIASVVVNVVALSSAFAEEKMQLPEGEPPQFFIVTAIHRKGLVLQRRPPPTKDVVAAPMIEYKPSFAEIRATDPKGKEFTADEIARRVKPGSVVLVGADDQPVDPVFLTVVKDDAVVLTGVIPRKGASAAQQTN